MKKKILFILVLTCLFLSSVFSYSGIYSGEKNLKVLKTTYFDIIYPPSCDKTASLLYENADKIYKEVTAQYGKEPSFTLPIVITPTVDTYNAFYTPAPFNRIVLYDTSSSVLDDLSSSFSESFLSTFRHELTHAVTYNLKYGFWDGFSSIFGDVMVPGYFFVTSGMAEGAAVASESLSGEGRLNNEYAKHFVKQAKIENKFPSFYEVQGSSNTSIVSNYYYFNGAFHEYLQNKYGLLKYAEFWEYVVNLKRPGISWSFDKVYGVSIREAWKDFINTYPLPENIETNVLKEGISKDFFNQTNITYSKENNRGERYSSLFSTDKGIYFTEDFPLYKNSKKLLFVDKEDLLDNDNKIKTTTIFTKQLLEGVIPSRDGRFIACSCLSNIESNMSNIVEIYDTENKSFFKVDVDGFKNASIVQKDNDYYIVGHTYNSPSQKLVIKKLILENNKIKDIEDIYSEDIEFNTFISSFTSLGNGLFSYIKKDKFTYSIVIKDVNGMNYGEYQLPKGIEIRELSYGNNKLFFSYVKENSMPRFAFLDLEKCEFFFSTVDLSGGVFNPILLNEDDKNTLIAYKGIFYDEDRLLLLDKDSSVLKEGEKLVVTKTENKVKQNKEEVLDIHPFNPTSSSLNITPTLNIKKEIDKEHEEFSNLSKIEEDYKWYKNIYRGVIIPFSIYQSSTFGEGLGLSSISQNLPYGITYATSNPWSTGTDDLLIASMGYSHLSNSFGIDINLNKGMGTSLFFYNVDVKNEFDRNGWKQSGLKLDLGSAFSFGKTSSFSVQNNLSILGGRSNIDTKNINALNLLSFWDSSNFEISSGIRSSNAFNVSDIINVSYSNVHKTGSGLFEKSGIKVGLGAGFIYDSVQGHQAVLSSDITYYIPRLIPISQKKGLTYNLPLILDLSILPLVPDYGLTRATFKNAGYGVIEGNIHAVLFAWDIQNVIPYVESIYWQKSYLTFGYDFSITSYKGTKSGFQPLYLVEYLSNLSNGESLYLDSLYMQLTLDITPNIGVLANSNTMIKMFARFSYPLHEVKGIEEKFKFSFGINTTF